jgi:hypothetical protein
MPSSCVYANYLFQRELLLCEVHFVKLFVI